MTLSKKNSNKTVSKSSKKASTGKVRSAKAFRTYDSAMKYIFSMTDYEKQSKMRYNVTTFDLSRMQKFLKQVLAEANGA